MQARCKDRGTIERVSGTGVFTVSAMLVRCVQEGVVPNHIGTHVVGPFEDLGAYIGKEGVG